jgi:hypothetical protein
VGRPWGVTLFWLLLCVVVPSALFRIGMAVVNRLRPRAPATTAAAAVPGNTPALPWFAPGASPPAHRKEPSS